ncbi:MAG TPA: thioredoxin family protein [Bacillales bacterium]
MLQEVEPEELKIDKGTKLIFFHTPLCGTCTEARKMLNIALEAVSAEIPAYACDLNFSPGLAERWKIESVPCLLLFTDGTITERVYAFRSVSDLYQLLQKKM